MWPSNKHMRPIKCDDMTFTPPHQQKFIERRWTIIALRTLIFYLWSNIELTWHECSFIFKRKKFVEPNLGLFKIGLILSIWLYSKQQKLLIQNLFLKYF